MIGRGYPNPYATRARGARESRSGAERAERNTPTEIQSIIERNKKKRLKQFPLTARDLSLTAETTYD